MCEANIIIYQGIKTIILDRPTRQAIKTTVLNRCACQAVVLKKKKKKKKTLTAQWMQLQPPYTGPRGVTNLCNQQRDWLTCHHILVSHVTLLSLSIAFLRNTNSVMMKVLKASFEILRWPEICPC